MVAAVSAPHRAEAFAAARFAIDALKVSVPIWKHETWRDGSDWGTGAADADRAATSPTDRAADVAVVIVAIVIAAVVVRSPSWSSPCAAVSAHSSVDTFRRQIDALVAGGPPHRSSTGSSNSTTEPIAILTRS